MQVKFAIKDVCGYEVASKSVAYNVGVSLVPLDSPEDDVEIDAETESFFDKFLRRNK